MEFRDVAQKVFSLYGNGAFGDALEIVREARSRFPERDSTLTFWEACLLSLGGEPGRALDALAGGLDRGLFWDRGLLADPDLDAAKSLDPWPKFEERSAAIIESLELQRPETMVREADDPVGTMVALHGAGDVPEDFFVEWSAAVPPEWTLIAPAGDVPVSNLRWAWPYDLSTDSLVAALETQSMSGPVVMSGYSQGARLAAEAAWNGLVDLSGLILSAATLDVEMWTASRRTPVPVYAVVGTEDLAYQPLLATSEALRADGVPVHLDVRPGLGHMPPDDLGEVMVAGLAWIASRR